MKNKIIILAVAMAISGGLAEAKDKKKRQTREPQAAAEAGEVEAGKTCTAEANAKDLHGAARKEFRKICMKSAVQAIAAKPVEAGAPTSSEKQR